MAQHPIPLHLCNLQVLADMSIERDSTIIFSARLTDSLRSGERFIQGETVPGPADGLVSGDRGAPAAPQAVRE